MKRFSQWHTLKSTLDSTIFVHKGYKEREVWWASIGLNVGFEEDGKGTSFNRPALIVKGFNTRMFWGVPLSTTTKRGKYYYEFTVRNTVSVALLSQLRTFDAKRLLNKYGVVQLEDFTKIKEQIRNLLL